MGLDIHRKLDPRELKAPIRDFLSPKPDAFIFTMKVEEVLQTLQQHQGPKKNFLYVIDENNILMGIVTMKNIIHSTPTTCLQDLIEEELIFLYEEDSLKKALEVITESELLSIPVVNTSKEFLGLLEIYHPDHPSLHEVPKFTRKQIAQDIFQIIGFSMELGKLNSSWIEFRYRMPWLACNVVGGLVCAIVGEIFQLTLVEFVMIAIFIPLVLSLSESVAIQSMTIALRFLHFKKIIWSQVWKRLFVEWKTSFLLGVASAVLLSAFYFLWNHEILPIIAIDISIVIAMMFSACFGALFPIFLHAIKLDPKVAAGPLVLMSADIMTVIVYLSLTTWILLYFP